MKANSWKLVVFVSLSAALCGCRKSDSKDGVDAKLSGKPSDAPVEIAQKWKAGQRYVMRMESAQTMQLPNFAVGRGRPSGTNTQPMENNFAQEYSLAVTNAPDGNRGMEMEVLAIELQSGRPDQQQINYDSRNKVAREGGPIADTFDRIVGGKIRYLISPENKVLKVEGIKELFERADGTGAEPAVDPAQAAQRRGTSRAPAGMLRGMYNEEVFKQMIELSGAPPKAVRVGETWTNSREVAAPVIGKLTVNTTNTFRGWQEHDGKKCVRVDFTGSMTFSGEDSGRGGGMPMSMTLKDGSLSGEYWYAPEVGISIDTTVDQNYTVTIGGLNAADQAPGQPPASRGFSAPVRQNVSVKLLEVKTVQE